MRSGIPVVGRRGFSPVRETGQVLVEFALVLPLLLFPMLVALEVGLALEIKHSFSVAAREAAQRITAAATPSSERTAAFAEQIVRKSLTEKFGQGSSVTSGAAVSVAPSPVDAAIGTRITIRVTYPMNFIWSVGGGHTTTVSGEAVFESQGQ